MNNNSCLLQRISSINVFCLGGSVHLPVCIARTFPFITLKKLHRHDFCQCGLFTPVSLWLPVRQSLQNEWNKCQSCEDQSWEVIMRFAVYFWSNKLGKKCISSRALEDRLTLSNLHMRWIGTTQVLLNRHFLLLLHVWSLFRVCLSKQCAWIKCGRASKFCDWTFIGLALLLDCRPLFFLNFNFLSQSVIIFCERETK